MSAFAEETEAASEATTEAGSTATADTTGGTTPLVVGSQNFSEKFSAFFAESVPDQTIVNLTNLYLIENDRSGSIIYRARRSRTTARITRTIHWRMLPLPRTRTTPCTI